MRPGLCRKEEWSEFRHHKGGGLSTEEWSEFRHHKRWRPVHTYRVSSVTSVAASRAALDEIGLLDVLTLPLGSDDEPDDPEIKEEPKKAAMAVTSASRESDGSDIKKEMKAAHAEQSVSVLSAASAFTPSLEE